MAILTNYEGSNDDYENGGSNGGRGQTFKVSSNSTCTGVQIYGSKGGASSGTTKVSILSGGFNGTELASVTVNTSTLSAYGSPAWNTFTFDASCSLTAGVEYYLKIENPTGHFADELRWSTDSSSPSYSDGEAYYWNGSSWVTSGTRDKNFRVEGSVPSSDNSSFFLVM